MGLTKLSKMLIMYLKMTHHSHKLIKSLACLRSYNSSLSSSVSILKVFTWLLRLFTWPTQDTVTLTCLNSLSRSNGPEQPHHVPRFRQDHLDVRVGKVQSQCAGHTAQAPCYLIKFLISFSAQVFTIFLGFPLQ